jgi:hypothetical protein
MTLRLPQECGGQTLYGHGGGTVAFNTTRFDEEASPLPKLLATALRH